MITIAVFDARPYDRDHLQPAAAGGPIGWHFLEFGLTRDTVPTAKGDQAVCVFVNDQLGRPCLEEFLTREALADIARTTVANLEALAGGKSYVDGSMLN